MNYTERVKKVTNKGVHKGILDIWKVTSQEHILIISFVTRMKSRVK